MASTFLLLFGLATGWASLVTAVRVRHPASLNLPVFFTAWLTGEYPLFHLITQAIVALLLVLLGGLAAPLGWLGLALWLAAGAGLLYARVVSRRAEATGLAALRAGLGDHYLDQLEPQRRDALREDHPPGLARHPIRHDSTRIEIHRNLAYGDHPKRNLLDLYQPTNGAGAAPVILQIHGGAWVTGNKEQQAQPLLHRLASVGYVGVSINYRLGRKHRFPAQIIDVKRAIAWVRANIDQYGGDPSTIILTGGSAGAHLASLAALTPNEASWQPGFEGVDTSVAACVPFYGPPDFTNRDAIRGRRTSLERFLTRMVMPAGLAAEPELWNLVSPMSNVSDAAPPFFVIQGENDVLVWREEARAFVAALRATSPQPVVYWEVPGAQHAFDTFNSHRSAVAVDMVEQFVGWAVGTRRQVAQPGRSRDDHGV